MIAASGLRWLLSAMFALPTLYSLWLMVAPVTSLNERVSHVLHSAMGVAMIAMVWPWGMDLSSGPQVVLFTAGALWFAGAALIRVAPGARAGALVVALPHVVMMGAMAWMVRAMGSSHQSAGHAGGVHDMAGMHMSGGSATVTMSLVGGGPRLTAGVLAVVLLAIAMRWLAGAFDRGRVVASAGSGAGDGIGNGNGALDLACHAAMALGMAVMFVLLV
ncbi:DUF5134 domain-containing protein [Streptomyces sp. NPDC046977]|uniref:DUF5134 domain-containing protein n=1 Tax=Streptomyces sp. NPDC046977 TaxID=3154703 RepID=UPI0033CB0B95